LTFLTPICGRNIPASIQDAIALTTSLTRSFSWYLSLILFKTSPIKRTEQNRSFIDMSELPLHFFIKNKLVSALLLCSIVLMFAYWLGIFDKQLNLLDSKTFANTNKIEYGSVTGQLQYKDKMFFKSTCQMPGSKDVDFCGFAVHFTESVDKGIDLSDFSSVSINLSIEAPVKNPRIRLSLRNFSDKYSMVSNPRTFKYNSLLVKPTVDTSLVSITADIPLEYVYVDYWWVNELGLSIEDAQVDLTNVLFMEVLNQDTRVEGTYSFTITSLVFKGSYVSITQLLVLNSILWALVIFLLIRRQGRSLLELSTIDTLTGLTNRRGLQVWVDDLKLCEKKPQELSLFYIDIDDFKKTNDTFGHKAGDLLLQGFCERVSEVIMQYKSPANALLLSRMSGDEFVLICRNIDKQITHELANAILQSLVEPLKIENDLIQVNISMGIAEQQIRENDTTKLFKEADAAMYVAKKSGKNQFRVFCSELDTDIFQHKSVAKIIADAIALSQFDLKFMPIFDMKTKLVKNVEVLIRSDTPELDGLSTKKIVEIAEEFNLIQELDEWVLNNTLALLSENKELIERLGLTFCINVSTLDLQNKSFFERIKQSLELYQIPAAWIELEITENALSQNCIDCTACLLDLQQLGVSLALDEFGTGYTAFNQLINYPVSKIKIDNAYVSAIGKDDAKIKVLTDAIINIADSFDLQVTAVGIETLDQYYYFAEKGCDFAQGYLLSEPLTLRELVRGLRNQEPFALESKVNSGQSQNEDSRIHNTVTKCAT